MKTSVVICTHNPRRDYLERTLDSLRSQSLDRTVWELIIVDNQSSPPLTDWVDLSWHEHGRIAVENELGLTPARLAGLSEAQGDVIVFADDDNVLAPDYLEEALRIFAMHPRIGCIGAGILTPEFESPPLPETLPYLSYLALRESDQDYWGNQISGMIPWGAGLAVRKEAGRLFRERIIDGNLARELGRTGASLMSGEDNEFSHAAVDHGWGIGIFVSLRIKHLIPSRRLKTEYLERLVEANGTTRAVLSYLHGEEGDPPCPVDIGQLLKLLGKVSPRVFLKKSYGWFCQLKASTFDRRMARLLFRGWLAAWQRLNARS
jgi:glycosyltransferase involved in cell wall biosynthesis